RASDSHPSVVPAVAEAGGKLVDTRGVEPFAEAMERESGVSLVVMTRLAVTYEILSVEEIRTIVQLAHDRGALVYVDDAGGARVGPAAFDQPRTLELGVDLVATGPDNAHTLGRRLRAPAVAGTRGGGMRRRAS